MFHYSYVAYKRNDISFLSFPEISQYSKYGYLGVYLFFIISGFVIAFSSRHLSLKKFLYSRFMRLYPMFWICMFITFVVSYFFGGDKFPVTFKQFIFNLTMAPVLFGQKNVDGAYWTLLIELKFYFFVSIFIVINKIKRIKVDYFIYFWLLLSSLNLFDVTSKIFYAIDGIFILDCSPYFIAGIVLCQVYLKGPKLKHFIMLSLSMYLSVLNGISTGNELSVLDNNVFSNYVIGGVIILSYVLMLLISLEKLQFLNSSKFVKIGMLTYPLYMIHQNIGYIIFTHFYFMNKYLLVFATILFMLGVSYILCLIEPKFIKIINLKSEALRKVTSVRA
ncbi:hypothetical protein CMU11_01245 [Elizabethkingia anophelis]|nr:acyltransferase [Elizabethkingia anophelis]AVF50505.1 acyltransferase [Elizabethkingia anophelis]MDV2457869.1 hypothetical protein [Elizabethkingia anophelis]MDV2465746.1 hypothetical protein [Elizabethkingia anophelis]MDV2472255.1 hypothetical protein [Elizabethkingia anophelis]